MWEVNFVLGVKNGEPRQCGKSHSFSLQQRFSTGGASWGANFLIIQKAIHQMVQGVQK